MVLYRRRELVLERRSEVGEYANVKMCKCANVKMCYEKAVAGYRLQGNRKASVRQPCNLKLVSELKNPITNKLTN
jgi:hypothetical protein